MTLDDLDDEGELGSGAYGTVNKMRHKATEFIMAVKVGSSPPCLLLSLLVIVEKEN